MKIIFNIISVLYCVGRVVILKPTPNDGWMKVEWRNIILELAGTHTTRDLPLLYKQNTASSNDKSYMWYDI